ncbi:MAG TPA: hypothetical protein PKD72_01185 [Gemmatales bacterium]|nr:hypothetical protein [Gemmatales bacterium]
MQSTWRSILILAQKDLALLARDRRSAILLLVMPIIFIFVLGMALGENFGQKPDDRLRISLVDQDEGNVHKPSALAESMAWLHAWPQPIFGSVPSLLGTCAYAYIPQQAQFPFETWAKVVIRDLAETADSPIFSQLSSSLEAASVQPYWSLVKISANRFMSVPF